MLIDVMFLTELDKQNRNIKEVIKINIIYIYQLVSIIYKQTKYSYDIYIHIFYEFFKNYIDYIYEKAIYFNKQNKYIMISQFIFSIIVRYYNIHIAI